MNSPWLQHATRRDRFSVGAAAWSMIWTKALRSCDGDVFLPQQAHDDWLGHRKQQQGELGYEWQAGAFARSSTPPIALQSNFLKCCETPEMLVLHINTHQNSRPPKNGCDILRVIHFGSNWSYWVYFYRTDLYKWYTWIITSPQGRLDVAASRSSLTSLRRSTVEPARAEVWWCHRRTKTFGAGLG